MYVGQILGILAMAAAKLSVIFLFFRLTERKPLRFRVTFSFIMIWTLFSLIAILFQCQLPHPYVLIPSQCSTHGAIYYPIIILNVLTDADLAICITPALWSSRMRLGQRLLGIFLFGTRILVCFAAIVELVFVARALKSPDQTWVSFDRAICDLSVIHLSVICAIFPRTNKLLSRLQSSNITVGINDFELNQAGLRTGAAPNSEAQPDAKAGATPTKDLKIYSTMWV